MTKLSDQFRDKADELNVQIDALSIGPESATVAIVGQGPGEAEARTGKPFVGKTSKILWRHLNPVGITVENAYCTNVVKRQMSTRGDKPGIRDDELFKWQDLLRWELAQLPNLKYVLLVGGYALEACTELQGIMNWRGSVIDMTLEDGREVKAMPMLHSAYVSDTPRAEIVFVMDCKKFGTLVNNKFKPYELEHIINPTFKESMDFIRYLKKDKRPVSWDIEAVANETACWGLANSGDLAMCIGFRDRGQNKFTVQQEADLCLAFQDLCDSHRIVAQNGSFDAYWSWLRDHLRVCVWHDTMLAHHTLYPQLPHSLAFLVSQYTNHPYYKDDFHQWEEGGDIDEFWRYNCKDAALTYRIHERLDKSLKEQGIDKFFYDHVMRAQPHLVEATVHGVAVDMNVKEQIRAMCEKDLQVIEREFYRCVEEATGREGYMPNPASWQQLKVLFFDYLKLRGKGLSTDETNRMYMMKDKGTSPESKEMLVALNKWKAQAKFYGTYAESRVSKDNRFRTEYKQAGVTNAPGRLSSTQLLDGDGGNMQNQPVRARSFFVADDGCELAYFDLGQAEARVVGWRAGIDKWMEQFEQARLDGKYDAHRALASEMFNVEYDKVPTKDWDENDQPTIRYVAKRCRHGLNYRMEIERLSEVTELPYHVATRAFMLYHKINPELVPWWEYEEDNFRKNRVTWNALGRRFRILQVPDEDALRSCVAFYPQSTVGDKITQVWYQAEEDDRWPYQARVGIDVHDNLVAISPPRYTKTCLSILKKYAESPIKITNIKTGKIIPLIIPAECKISYPTKPKFTQGKLEFIKDVRGLHRWSHMAVVDIKAAA